MDFKYELKFCEPANVLTVFFTNLASYYAPTHYKKKLKWWI